MLYARYISGDGGLHWISIIKLVIYIFYNIIVAISFFASYLSHVVCAPQKAIRVAVVFVAIQQHRPPSQIGSLQGQEIATVLERFGRIADRVAVAGSGWRDGAVDLPENMLVSLPEIPEVSAQCVQYRFYAAADPGVAEVISLILFFFFSLNILTNIRDPTCS